jgi:DNA (cytosine-5)-methyltransferase 1
MLKPAFFVAENVPGILAARNSEALRGILEEFTASGYNVKYAKLNAAFHDVPEDRERVIFVGIRSDIKSIAPYKFPLPSTFSNGQPKKLTMQEVPALNALAQDAAPFNPSHRLQDQNEYMEGGFSPLFMSRNRCRTWSEPSFTIQATARHAPLHPEAGRMTKIGEDSFAFTEPSRVRRLSVRECAEIQTFPSSHKFIFKNITDGYKMIGNAVPVNLARAIARSIGLYFVDAEVPLKPGNSLKPGTSEYVRDPYKV